MNIPEKWLAITTTEFYEICTNCEDDELKHCTNQTQAWNGRCYQPVLDYPDVQICNKYEAMLHAMAGFEVRPAPGGSL
jgi:hypothetical protein